MRKLFLLTVAFFYPRNHSMRKECDRYEETNGDVRSIKISDTQQPKMNVPFVELPVASKTFTRRCPTGLLWTNLRVISSKPWLRSQKRRVMTTMATCMAGVRNQTEEKRLLSTRIYHTREESGAK